VILICVISNLLIVSDWCLNVDILDIRMDHSKSNGTGEKPVKSKRQLTSLAKNYLILYNLVQTLGWSYLLYQIIEHYTSENREEVLLYDAVKCSLIIFQNLAMLEVVHATLRIVPSNPVITLQQIASRVVVVCGVLMATDAARLTIGFPLVLFAWSVTEIIRYANYTLNLIDAVPYFLVWLRYSTFIILYPMGVTGELLCLYAAQREVKENGLWSISMPNRANVIFNYSYFLLTAMSLYLPLFPQMYLHMVSQRKKVLGKPVKQH